MNVENWFMPANPEVKSRVGPPPEEIEAEAPFKQFIRPLHAGETRFATATPVPLPTEVKISEPFESLSVGSSSKEVGRVQNVLRKWNSGLNVSVTGRYDSATRDALTLYKAIYGGEGDGSTLDQKTARQLRMMEDGTFWNDPPTKSPIQEMLYHASRDLGKPYVLGGDGVHCTDCGMLTALASKQSGLGSLSRLADMQYLAAKRGQNGLGYHRESPAPGDLVFFRVPTSQSSIAHDGVTHVTLYVKDGLTLAASSAAGKVILQPLSQLDQYVAGYGRFEGQSVASR